MHIYLLLFALNHLYLFLQPFDIFYMLPHALFFFYYTPPHKILFQLMLFCKLSLTHHNQGGLLHEYDLVLLHYEVLQEHIHLLYTYLLLYQLIQDLHTLDYLVNVLVIDLSKNPFQKLMQLPCLLQSHILHLFSLPLHRSSSNLYQEFQTYQPSFVDHQHKV